MASTLNLTGFVRLTGSSMDTSKLQRPRIPAARHPGHWLPKRELAGVDAVVDAADFHNWLVASVEGEIIAYFLGLSLPLARQLDSVLDRLATEVMLASAGGSLLRVSRCFHVRGRYVGNGAVALMQRRVLAPEPGPGEADDDPAAPHGAERGWHWLHLARRLP